MTELANEQHILSKLRAEWQQDLKDLKDGQAAKLVSFSDDHPNDEPEVLTNKTQSSQRP